MALVDRDQGIASERALHAAGGEAQHVVLARLDLLHVDGDRARDRHAELAGTPCQMGGVGARHQRLGRSAACIDARSAETMPLDDGNALSCSRQSVC